MSVVGAIKNLFGAVANVITTALNTKEQNMTNNELIIALSENVHDHPNDKEMETILLSEEMKRRFETDSIRNKIFAPYIMAINDLEPHLKYNGFAIKTALKVLTKSTYDLFQDVRDEEIKNKIALKYN